MKKDSWMKALGLISVVVSAFVGAETMGWKEAIGAAVAAAATWIVGYLHTAPAPIPTVTP